MSKFKVGDKVRWNGRCGSGFSSLLPVSAILTIKTVDNCILFFGENSLPWDECCFDLVSSPAEGVAITTKDVWKYVDDTNHRIDKILERNEERSKEMRELEKRIEAYALAIETLKNRLDAVEERTKKLYLAEESRVDKLFYYGTEVAELIKQCESEEKAKAEKQQYVFERDYCNKIRDREGAEVKHSPLPWEAKFEKGTLTIRDANGNYVCELDACKIKGVPFPIFPFADQILIPVNHFEELLEAVEKILKISDCRRVTKADLIPLYVLTDYEAIEKAEEVQK